MYYLARKLYLSATKQLAMQVVEVEQNRVVSISPFDGEKESMLLVDTLLLSDKKLPLTARSIEDVLSNTMPEFSEANLYIADVCDSGISILPIQ